MKNLKLLILLPLIVCLSQIGNTLSVVNMSVKLIQKETIVGTHVVTFTICKRIEIDTYVTATNGCEFHVTGWVDITWSIRDGFEVGGYDITAEGPCGNYHFEDNPLMTPSEGELFITAQELNDILKDIIDDELEGN